MMNEKVILCEPSGENIGVEDKMQAHLSNGILHRAFSVFLFDQLDRIVIQRRSAAKFLWPMVWSNACCSHYGGESNQCAQVSNRVMQELGCAALELTSIGDFQYIANYKSVGAECELCDIWLGRTDSKNLSINDDEVNAVAFLSIEQMTNIVNYCPAALSPWSSIEWPLVKSFLDSNNYLDSTRLFLRSK